MIEGFDLREESGIYMRPEAASFCYSDGDETENRIYQAIRDTADVSVGSAELYAKATDWATIYHFSPQRANLLRPLEPNLKGDILELGAGCGAITRYLGETGARVTAVEGSARLAGIARERCRGLDNVSVYCDDFQRFPNNQKFDVVTLIGVQEYSRMFIKDVNPVAAALQLARSFLKPDGLLVVAIENPLGLKYFAGAPEDHLLTAYSGIEDQPDAKGAVNSGRKVLKSYFKIAGFEDVNFFYPFPDYKLPTVILSETGINRGNYFLTNLLFGQSARNQMFDYLWLFSEASFWGALAENAVAADLSNSFLVAARIRPGLPATDASLAYVYSAERHRHFARAMQIIETPDGTQLIRRPLFADNIEGESYEPYVEGRLYGGRLTGILASPGWSVSDIIAWAQPWLAQLRAAQMADGTLPVRWLDETPFNLMEDLKGELVAFDFEWDESTPVDLGYVAFRGLLHSLLRVGAIAAPAADTSLNIVELITAVMDAADLDGTARLSFYLAAEYKLQGQVSQRPAAPEAILQFTLPVKFDPMAAAHATRHAFNLAKALARHVETINRLEEEILEQKRIHQDESGRLRLELAAHGEEISRRHLELAAVYSSKSWRATEELRRLLTKTNALKSRWQKLQRIKHASGGWRKTAIRAVKSLLRSGPGFAFNRFRTYDLLTPHSLDPAATTGPIDYQRWIAWFDTRDENAVIRIHAEIERMPRRPTFSVVMPTYNTPESLLRLAIDSIRSQLYPDWELCIADDASTAPHVRQLLQKYADADSRIKMVFRKENGHIAEASNSALALATGQYVALFDHDDELPEHALFEVAKAILAHPHARMFYSDEDKLATNGQRIDPYFKSDWNPDLFLSQNMFSHLGVYDASLIREAGGFQKGTEGSQDYDLALRCLEIAGHAAVVHIPKVLYHWRIIPGSTAAAGSEKPYALVAAIHAVEAHLKRTGIDATVEEAVAGMAMLRVRYALPPMPPRVSIIIPTRNASNLVRQCIDSILAKTTYPDYEIILVDNGSDDPHALDYFSSLAVQPNIIVLRDDSPFNYSRLNNYAVARASGELVCLLNNDIEVISPDWLGEMVSQALRPEIGAVGARLWYPDDTLQHGGVVLGFGGVAGHMHSRITRANPGYFGRAWLVQNLSAVTAACLVIRKSVYEEVQGLEEQNLTVAFNDVDFCIRILKAGYRNLWTPFAELYHYESATRGSDIAPDKVERFKREIQYMRETHGASLYSDSAYNPNLDLERTLFGIARNPRQPWADKADNEPVYEVPATEQ